MARCLYFALLLWCYLPIGAFAQALPFAWVQSAGGGGSDIGYSAAVDGDGDSYVVGRFRGTAAFGAQVITSAGGTDVFVAKYNPLGAVLWAQPVGGAGDDLGYGVAVSGDGGCFVTGAFSGTAGFASTNLTSTGGFDVFLARFDADGTLQWVRQAGGTNDDFAYSLGVDGGGNCYLAGSFRGKAVFDPTNLVSAGASDLFLARYQPDGSLGWARRAGGPAVDAAFGLAVSTAGDCYVTGSFQGTNSFGVTNLVGSGAEDGFVARYSSAGQVQWALQIAGVGGSVGASAALDGAGNCFVTGYFSGPTSFGSTNLNSSGAEDIFVAKYNAAGICQWARPAGGVSHDQGYGVAVDGLGDCYVTGYFNGTAAFGPTNLASAGNSDIFIAKYSGAGGFLGAAQAGGSSDETGLGLAVDAAGACFVVGDFQGNASFGATNLASIGGSDIFVAKLGSAITIVGQPPGSTIIAGSDLILSLSGVSPSALGYQWQLNGTNLPGATGNTLSLTNLQPSQAGAYSALVSNTVGALTSSPISLNVDYALNVIVDGIGTVAREPDLIAFPPNSMVTVTAAPADAFLGWSGDASGTNNPLALLMDANRTVTAHFAARLNLKVQGSGSVSLDPNQARYAVGDSLSLSAAAGRWFAFSQWSDGDTNNPRGVTLEVSNSFTAVFTNTIPLETLNYGGVSRTAPVGMPAIFVNGQFVVSDTSLNRGAVQVAIQTTFPNGLVLYTLDGSDPRLIATPYTGSFNLATSATLRALALSADFSQSAEADPIDLVILPSLTATTAGGGTVSTDGPYPSNLIASATAAAAPGWTFLGWTGDATGTDATVLVTMTRDKCVQAVFGTTLRTNVVTGSGGILLDSLASLYPYGWTVRCVAVPDTNYYFASWGGAGSGTNNPFRLSVLTTNPTVTAAFFSLSANQYTMTVLADGEGQVSNNPVRSRYSPSQSVTNIALPEPGQDFLGWSGDASGTNNPLILSMTQRRVVTAHFTRRPRLSIPTCGAVLGPGGFQVVVSGPLGIISQIEASTNLVHWQGLGWLTNIFGTMSFQDSSAPPNYPRYYRAIGSGQAE